LIIVIDRQKQSTTNNKQTTNKQTTNKQTKTRYIIIIILLKYVGSSAFIRKATTTSITIHSKG